MESGVKIETLLQYHHFFIFINTRIIAIIVQSSSSSSSTLAEWTKNGSDQSTARFAVAVVSLFARKQNNLQQLMHFVLDHGYVCTADLRGKQEQSLSANWLGKKRKLSALSEKKMFVRDNKVIGGE